ncbi:DUF4082 domain-containing protein [Microbacterium capsulatum]|uniref:DUF4082 domain-containing protein n=1 Tax=Microbacterium capsulatum TaxID=3041921 RepID=A0ABU0XGL9_9MICO|nr:DUF4082 domain-containing protein [Microbacterium sp. ASV81]MDQ4214277.1 DUF4082 domain-containing protein [Microbacterium sp. ASV81]
MNPSPTRTSLRRIRSRRSRFAFIAAGAALVVAAGTFAAVTGAFAPSSADAAVSMFPDTMTPKVAAEPDHKAVELGITFTPDRTGEVTALRYYQGSDARGVTDATLWSSDGAVLAHKSFPTSQTVGWRTIPLDAPVPLTGGRTYVASYNAPNGGYAATENDLTTAKQVNGFSLRADAGVYRYGHTDAVPKSTYRGSNYLVDVVFHRTGHHAQAVTAPTTSPKPSTSPRPTAPATTTPTPAPTTMAKPSPAPTTPPTSTAPPAVTVPGTTTPPVSSAGCVGSANTPGGADPWGGCWPGPQNTGYPHGLPGDTRAPVTLTTYTGPTTITSCGVVIDSKIVNDTIIVQAGNGTTSKDTPCVTIRNSLVKGVIYSEQASYGPVLIEDTEVHPSDLPWWENIGRSNFFAYRVNSHGGEGVIKCDTHCEAADNWVHGMQLGGSYHYNAFGGNGTNDFRILHNYASCGDWESTSNPGSDAGCSAVIGFYGDFGPIQNITIDHNYLASTFDMSASGLNTQAGYCLNPGYYPGKPYPDTHNLTVTNNLFARGGSGKCGVFGPTNSLNAIGAPNGNIWQANRYSDGTAIARVEQ